MRRGKHLRDDNPQWLTDASAPAMRPAHHGAGALRFAPGCSMLVPKPLTRRTAILTRQGASPSLVDKTIRNWDKLIYSVD
jgi:hypothetical protein